MQTSVISSMASSLLWNNSHALDVLFISQSNGQLCYSAYIKAIHSYKYLHAQYHYDPAQQGSLMNALDRRAIPLSLPNNLTVKLGHVKVF